MKPIFRSAMFGFHKEDVFNFINKQYKQYEAKITELNEEIEKQATDFETERKSFQLDSAELENLRSETEELRKAMSSIVDSVSNILDDKEKILACVSTLEKEQSQVQAKFSEMNEKVAEAERIRAKAEKFDQLSGVLSSIFNQSGAALDAQTPCDSVEIDECSFDFNAAKELLQLVESLSTSCENLKSVFPAEKIDG